MARRPWPGLARRDAAIQWDGPDEPGSNLRHVLDTGFTAEDVEHVLRDPATRVEVNRGHADFIARGVTGYGEVVNVPFDLLDTDPVRLYPRTIYLQE